MTISGTRGPGIVLSDRLVPGLIRTPLAARSKAGILGELSGLLADGAGVPDRASEIHDAIVRRESLLSTGIGRGVALPHAKCTALETLAMAVGTTAEPVEFDSVDGAPVRLVWMLAGPAHAAGMHVRTLAAISDLLRDDGLRDDLFRAAAPMEFLALVAGAESA